MRDEITYQSTRGRREGVPASVAILQGLANDGGLFVPDHLPMLDRSMKEFSAMDYQQTAYEVMKLLLTDFTESELRDCICRAYDNKFDSEVIAPIVEAEGAYYLELYHGRTLAFKDMALSILPHFMTEAVKKQKEKHEIVILTATSGDTGKAALEGFADVPGTRICVFYPKHGVSPIQEKQMVTQKGANTCVIGIEGNFDDAQTGVKKMFTDKELERKMDGAGLRFSSANSINIGRLIPQIVYYVYAYARLLGEGKIAEGDPVNFVVPTGNFGNILAAYYAKKMGLPVGKLICASNSNKVLFDFFKTGVYDRNRDFILTASPSMDILISSNLERLLFDLANRDTEEDSALMEALIQKGRYEISKEMREGLKDFYGNYATEEECADAIRELFEKTGYLIDTHTAVARAVYNKYRSETKDQTPSVIVSTASPFKFSRAVLNAIQNKPLGEAHKGQDDFALANQLAQLSACSVPDAVSSLQGAEIRHTTVCAISDMQKGLMDFLRLA